MTHSPTASGRQTSRSFVLERLEDRTVLTSVPVGSPIILNAVAPDWADVAMADDGSFVAVWADDAWNTGVIGKKVLADGSVVANFSMDVGAQVSSPKIGISATGAFTVVWTTPYDIRYQRFDAAATALGPAVSVGNAVAGSVSVDTNLTGSSVISWIDGADVHFLRLDNSGGTIASGILALGTNNYSAAAIDADGDFIVVWGSNLGGLSGRRFASNGTAIDLVPVTYGPNWQLGNVEVDMDSVGNATVVSVKQGLAGVPQVFTQTVSNQGVVSAETNLGSFNGFVDVSTTAYGDAQFVFDRVTLFGGFTTYLQTMLYDKDGDTYEVNPTRPGDGRMPRIATNDQGRLVVVTDTAAGLSAFVYDALIANPGGPYTLMEGESLTLNGAGSNNPFGGSLSYFWDLNGDGNVDAEGSNPTLTWTELQNLGLTDGPGAYQARLIVTDSSGRIDFSNPFTINVTNAIPVIYPGVENRNQTRGTVLMRLFIEDAPGDLVANYLEEVDWNNDGIFDEALSVPGNLYAYPFQHTYSTMGLKTIRVRATDKDGGVSAIVTTTFNVQPYVFNPSMYQDAWSWAGSAGDDEVAISLIDNTTLRITETKINGAAVNNVYNITTAAMDLRPTYVIAYGYEGNDRIDLSGLTAPLAGTYAYGGTGNDFIIGSAVVDSIFGELGNDTIHGGSGGDYIDGGISADLIYGEAPAATGASLGRSALGSDTIYGGDGDDILYGDGDGGEGRADYIYGDAGDDVIYGDGDKGSPNTAGDTIYGGTGNDQILADGAEGSPDFIYGEDGDDLVDAGGGNDFVYGGAGNDILLGGDGAEGSADYLAGEDGRDILVGDGGISAVHNKTGGVDTLEGGMGQDILIAGFVIPTANHPVNWLLVRQEWISGHSFAERIDNLAGVGNTGVNADNFLIPGANVFNDKPVSAAAIADIIFASNEGGDAESRRDWIFADISEDLTVNLDPIDILTNLSPFPRPA